MEHEKHLSYFINHFLFRPITINNSVSFLLTQFYILSAGIKSVHKFPYIPPLILITTIAPPPEVAGAQIVSSFINILALFIESKFRKHYHW